MKNLKKPFFAVAAAFVLTSCSSGKALVFDNPADEADRLKTLNSEIFVPYKKLTTPPGFHWFAYYDKLETDPSGRYVLAMKTDFEGRSPKAGDEIEIGMVDTQDGCKWVKLGTSKAWGWQQGCQLQFIPQSKSKVIWNDREGGKFVSRIVDVQTRKMRTINTPVYALSPDGKWAVTVDYSRVNDMRKGYGYSGIPDKLAAEKFPSNAGIWKVDLKTGQKKLIVSHADAMKIPNPLDPEFADAKHWFNHLLVSPDGKRFIFLHRWRYPDAARTAKYKDVGGFGTRMFTASVDGGDLRAIDPYNYTSHFIWDTESKNVVAWTRIPRNGEMRKGFYVIADSPTEKISLIGEGVMTDNGHNTFLSNHPEWILNDTYPREWTQHRQEVYIYNVKTGEKKVIARLNSPKGYKGELRCDTHPRSTPDGTKVIVDSAHDGGRQIYMFDISELIR